MNPMHSSAYGQSSYYPNSSDSVYGSNQSTDTSSSWGDNEDWPGSDSTVQDGSNSGSRSLMGSIDQMNAAIQSPGDASQYDIGTGQQASGSTSTSESTNGNGSSDATASDTSGAGDIGTTQDSQAQNTQDGGTNTSQQATEAQQKSQGQQVQQEQQAEGNKQSSAGQQAASLGQNAEQQAAMGGGADNESPGQRLTKEIQQTRQEMQGEPDDDAGQSGSGSSGGQGPSMGELALGGAAAAGGVMAAKRMGNKENVFTQTSQKAHMADQQHKQGLKKNMMGMMQLAKGRAMETAGAIQIRVSVGLNAAGTAMVSTGTALESNPFTAAIGAALIAAGNALKAAAVALKASGEVTKAKGAMMLKNGATAEREGQKMTKKASKSEESGHRALEALRNNRNESQVANRSVNNDAQALNDNPVKTEGSTMGSVATPPPGSTAPMGALDKKRQEQSGGLSPSYGGAF